MILMKSHFSDKTTISPSSDYINSTTEIEDLKSEINSLKEQASMNQEGNNATEIENLTNEIKLLKEQASMNQEGNNATEIENLKSEIKSLKKQESPLDKNVKKLTQMVMMLQLNAEESSRAGGDSGIKQVRTRKNQAKLVSKAV